MSKRITDRYLTLLFLLGDLPAGADEHAQLPYYELWNKAQKLIAPRQAALPDRIFLDEHHIECTRWEYCDQVAYVEAHGEHLVWPIQFYENRELSPEQRRALRDTCVAAFQEVCQSAGVPVAFARADLNLTYVYTERTTLPETL